MPEVATFQWAWWWWFAAIPLPLLAFWLVPRASSPVGAALRVPHFDAIAGQQTESSRPSLGRLLIASLIWLALIVAAARPQYVGEPVSIAVSGRDMMLAVDISGSMETADMMLSGQMVTRLAVVKAVAGEFLQRRVGDRLGLILFGRRAYLQTPLTFDRATTRILLDESAIGLAGKETAIGDAIGVAVKRLSDPDVVGDQTDDAASERVLILLTDGANTIGSVTPIKAAELAASRGLKIYTIGVGADEMLVRSRFGTRRINPSSDLDEPTLIRIAEITGGRYFRARDTEALKEIYSALDELEPVAEEEQLLRPPTELFYWPLGLAAMLSIMLAAFRLLVARGWAAMLPAPAKHESPAVTSGSNWASRR